MKVNLIDGKLLLRPETENDSKILERALNARAVMLAACGYGRHAVAGKILHVEFEVMTNKGETK